MAEPKDIISKPTLSPQAVVKIKHRVFWFPYVAFLSPLWSMSVAIFFAARHHTLFATSFAVAALIFAPAAVMLYKSMRKNIEGIFFIRSNGNQITVDAA